MAQIKVRDKPARTAGSEQPVVEAAGPPDALGGRPSGAAVLRVLLIASLLVPLVFLPQLYDIYDLTKATFLRLIFVLAAAFWVLHITLQQKIEIPRTPLLWPVLSLVALAAVLSLFSVNPVLSAIGTIKRHEGWTTFLLYGGLLLGAATFLRRRDLKAVSTIFAVVIILESVYGIFQRFGLDFMGFGAAGQSYDLTRAFGSTGNPVFLGTLLTVGVPYFAVLLFQPKLKHLHRVLYGAAAALGFAACVFTYSRGAWLGLLVAAPVVLALVGRRHLLARWKSVLAVVVALGLLFGAVALLRPTSSQFSSSVAERATAALDLSQGSSATRVEMWRSTLGVIKERPAFGWGLEQFKAAFPSHRSLKLIRLEGEFAMPDRPHNELLYIVSSLGLIGTAAILWVFIAFFWFAGRWLRTIRRIDREAAVYWGIAAIVAAAAGNLVAESTSFTTINTTPIIWLLMGFAAALAVPVARMRSVSLPHLSNVIRIPLYIFAVAWTALLAQYIVRFPVADYFYNEARFARAYNQLPEAQRYAELAVGLNPYQNLYRIELGAIYTDMRTRTQDLSWRQKAADLYEEAVLFDNYDEDSYANLGNSYLDLAQYRSPAYLERAENAFRRALVIDPYFSVAHMQLGSIYLAKKQYRGAVTEFEAARRVAGDEPSLLMLLGDAHLGSGDQGKALTAYKEALRLDPQNADAKKAVSDLSELSESKAQTGGK